MLHLSIEKKRTKGKWWLLSYLEPRSKYRLNGVSKREERIGQECGI